MLSGLPPPLTVRAAEDALCYRFPDPRPTLQHPERLQFSHYGAVVTRERLAQLGLVDQALRSARHQMRPVALSMRTAQRCVPRSSTLRRWRAQPVSRHADRCANRTLSGSPANSAYLLSTLTTRSATPSPPLRYSSR